MINLRRLPFHSPPPLPLENPQGWERGREGGKEGKVRRGERDLPTGVWIQDNKKEKKSLKGAIRQQ